MQAEAMKGQVAAKNAAKVPGHQHLLEKEVASS